MKPSSCDTFVALPPATGHGGVIFGKNSDRPCHEVQEVVHVPATDHTPGTQVQCTYIEIEQVPHTYAVMLSRPAWLWGAEMGANEHGVCIGNEAVWTKENGPEDLQEKLLGMDLVRIGLERGKTARESVAAITQALEKHGQGGACSDDGHMTYHNSFIVADRSEAWVLETVAKHWAGECIKSGTRNISNQLTIRTKIDMMSDGLKEHAQRKGWWKPDDGEFDFAMAYADSFEETELKDGGPCHGRQLWGTKLLRDYSQEGNFTVEDMFRILRDEQSGICMTGSFLSTASQVSVLPPGETGAPPVHWFTATPYPQWSFFKPFIFCCNASIGDKTISPSYGDKDPVRLKPRFQKKVDRTHALWRAHSQLVGWLEEEDEKAEELLKQIRQLEQMTVQDMQDVMKNFDEKAVMKVNQIFQHMVELEMNFYKQ